MSTGGRRVDYLCSFHVVKLDSGLSGWHSLRRVCLCEGGVCNTSTEFTCPNSRCIPLANVCDSHCDCLPEGTNSCPDERNCDQFYTVLAGRLTIVWLFVFCVISDIIGPSKSLDTMATPLQSFILCIHRCQRGVGSYYRMRACKQSQLWRNSCFLLFGATPCPEMDIARWLSVRTILASEDKQERLYYIGLWINLVRTQPKQPAQWDMVILRPTAHRDLRTTLVKVLIWLYQLVGVGG